MLENQKGSFPHSLAQGQAQLVHRKQVVLPVALEFADCRRWGKAKPILGGGELCLEEMAQALMGKVQELAGD